MDESRGPCAKCRHFREGGSVALAAFNAMPDGGRLKVMLRTTANQRRQEERAMAGTFIEEREIGKEDGTEEYMRRPTTPSVKYCGVAEFMGSSYNSDVKNKPDPGYSCKQFKILTEVDRTPHSCETCASNYRPQQRLIEALMAQVTSSGSHSQLGQFKEDVEQFLHSTAEAEYEECITNDGVLFSRPGLLPLCEEWSSSGRYVVGPVANAARRCGKWTPGANDKTSQITATLSALIARCDEAFRRYSEISNRTDQASWPLKPVVETEVGHAKADLIEFCMLFLGEDGDFAASVAARYSQQIWEPAHGKLAPWVSNRSTWRRLLDGTGPSSPGPAAFDDGAGTARASTVGTGAPARPLAQLLPGVWQIEESFLGGLKKTTAVLIFGVDGTVQARGGQGHANWSVTGGGKLKIWSPGRKPVFSNFSEIRQDRLVGSVRESGSLLSGQTVWSRL